MRKIREKAIKCQSIKWVGKVKLTKKEFIIFPNKAHKFEIDYENEKFVIEINSKNGLKEIVITANERIEFIKFEELLLEMIRYENLFDGRFFSFVELLIDKKSIARRRIDWVPYFFSQKKYVNIPFVYDDSEEYKKYFCAWIELSRELGIIHQMYLYAKYAKDITPDVKMALLSQTFEPIADILRKNGTICLPKKITVNDKKICTNCNNEIIIPRKKKIDFRYKLKAIIDTYGIYIFPNEAKDNLIDKTVKSRNKIVHLDKEKENTMSGEESGFYLYKFELLYRIIVFSELGLDENIYIDTVKLWVKIFDKKHEDIVIRE